MNIKRVYSLFFYFLFFAAVAFLMPNFILYYQGLGFSGIQIGILAGMAPLITMVGAPFWTGLADAKRIHKLIMSLVMLMTVLLACIFPLVSGLAPVVVLIGLYAFFTSPLLSMGDSATMTMLAGAKEMYGRMRLEDDRFWTGSHPGGDCASILWHPMGILGIRNFDVPGVHCQPEVHL